MTLDETLADRGRTYGSFESHAKLAQLMKRIVWEHRGWGKLADDQRQALEVIFDKIARVLNGDPDHKDSWQDIAGYAMLIVRRLDQEERIAQAILQTNRMMDKHYGPTGTKETPV